MHALDSGIDLGDRLSQNMAEGRPEPQPSSTAGKEPQDVSSKKPEAAFVQKEDVLCSGCMRSTEYTMPENLGELRGLPHELLEHVFPGLPQATIMELSTCSRHCGAAARKAIPRVKAALRVASLKGGCKRANPVQVRTMITVLGRFKAGRHIETDQPVPLVNPGTEFGGTHKISPTRKLSFRGSDDWMRVGYYVAWLDGGAGRPSLRCNLTFGLGHSAFLVFELDVAGGEIIPRLLCGECLFCEDVDLLQAFVLALWPTWGSGALWLTLPVKSPRECAAIVAGCKDIIWQARWAGDRHFSAEASSTESSVGQKCSKIGIWANPCRKYIKRHCAVSPI
eukprot:jgi/Botrbrau1/10910/Bobra.0025s0083.1